MNLPKRKNQSHMVLLVNCTENLGESISTLLDSLLQKIKVEGTLQGSFYEACIALNPKQYIGRKENYRLISVMNIGAQIFNKK